MKRVLLAVLVGFALTGSASTALAETITETRVKVEKVKPKKTKHPTVRFLRENLDFIRSRLDLVRQKYYEQGVKAGELDARFLAYQQMLEDIHAAEDTAAAAEDARRRMTLLQSISELGDLELQLDLMDSLLADQRTRLGVLQTDFTGEQRTSLIVLLSGYPSAVNLTEIAISMEDGTVIRLPVSAAQQQALVDGGLAQLYHGFVEPREQFIEVTIKGDAWPAGDSGYVTFNPHRDRLSFLKLDLSRLGPAGAGTTLIATTWLHPDAEVLSSIR